MYQLFLLCIFFSLSKQGCVPTQFIDKSRDQYPKPGAYCTSSEIEDRWRGELIYEHLEDLSGIRVKWKYIVQRPDCDTVELKFFVNDTFVKNVSPTFYKNIEMITLKAEDNFELKIQAQYKTAPKCVEATKTIKMEQTPQKITPGKDVETPIARKPDINFPELTADDQGFSGTDETKSQDPADSRYMTIIACSAGGSAIVLISIFVIGMCLWKSRSSQRNSPMEVDENTVYGTYAYGDDPDDDDYITAEDKNPYYEESSGL